MLLIAFNFRQIALGYKPAWILNFNMYFPSAPLRLCAFAVNQIPLNGTPKHGLRNSSKINKRLFV